MCGIYGFLSKKPKKYKGIVKALGYAMEERGTHSSGLLIDNKIFKLVGSSHYLFTAPDLIERLNQPAQMVIGHTRFATVGAITVANAHPISYPGITGVHNGHVSNYNDLGYPAGEFPVDSMAAFRLLSDHKNDYKAALKRIYGQINLAWTDGKKLYLVRHGNPLYIAVTEDALFFCSTDALETILTAAGMNFTMSEAVENKVMVLDKDMNYFEEKVEFGAAPPYFPKNTWTAPAATPVNPVSQANKYYKKPSPPLDVELENQTRRWVEDFIYYAHFVDSCDSCGHKINAAVYGMYIDVISGTAYCEDCYDPKNDMIRVKAKKVRKIEKKLRKRHDEIVSTMKENGLYIPTGMDADDFVGDIEDAELDIPDEMVNGNKELIDQAIDCCPTPGKLPSMDEASNLAPTGPTLVYPKQKQLALPRMVNNTFLGGGFKGVLNRAISKLNALEDEITQEMKGRHEQLPKLPPAVL